MKRSHHGTQWHLAVVSPLGGGQGFSLPEMRFQPPSLLPAMALAASCQPMWHGDGSGKSACGRGQPCGEPACALPSPLDPNRFPLG